MHKPIKYEEWNPFPYVNFVLKMKARSLWSTMDGTHVSYLAEMVYIKHDVADLCKEGIPATWILLTCNTNQKHTNYAMKNKLYDEIQIMEW